MKKTRLRIVQVCLSAIVLLQAVSSFGGGWLQRYWYVDSVFFALNVLCVMVVLNEFRTVSKSAQQPHGCGRRDADKPSVSPSR